jgi:hypothetical protein
MVVINFSPRFILRAFAHYSSSEAWKRRLPILHTAFCPQSSRAHPIFAKCLTLPPRHIVFQANAGLKGTR